jgi:membrane dipeptidase
MDAATLHRDALVIELHSDIPIDVVLRRRKGERAVLLRRHLPRWQAGGVKASVLTVGGDQASQRIHDPADPFRSALLTLQDVRADIRESEGALALVTTPAALRAEVAAGRFAVLLSLEGAAPLRGSLLALDLFAELGLRAIQLTWNLRNEVGDGIGEDHRNRLTRFGRALVGHATRAGILLDASHLGEGCFWDLAERATRPWICSHSNPAARHHHPRNVTDLQIEAVTRAGGLVGIACYPGFFAERPLTVEHVLDHVEHALRVAGPGHVGFGPDYVDYAADVVQAGLEAAGVGYGPMEPFPAGIARIEEVPGLTAGLLARGHPPDVIRGVLGESYLRVLDAVQAP